MSELDEIFTLWERFCSSSGQLGDVCQAVSESAVLDASQLPGGFLAAVLARLETLLDAEPDVVDQAELLKVIHILRRFPEQRGLKVALYQKCLRSFLTVQLDRVLFAEFFNLVEEILDPRRNWRDSNVEQDSLCLLSGSIADFTQLIVHCLTGHIPVPKIAKGTG